MGEYEVITTLAKQFMDNGDSAYWASRNAVVEYKIALKEALEYEYKEKTYRFTRKPSKHKKRSESVDKRYLDKIRPSLFIGTAKERLLVYDIADAMNESGLVCGFELMLYIRDCVKIEYMLNEDKTQGRKITSIMNQKKIYDFFESEADRIERNSKRKLC